MAESQGIIGYGTLLQFGDGASPEVFTSIAEVTNIDGPGLSRSVVEFTHMESPDGYREKKPGLKDGDEIALECNFLPGNATQDTATGVLSFFESGAIKNWRVVWPFSPTETWEFTGFVSNFAPTTPVDDKVSLAVTITLAGKPAFTS